MLVKVASADEDYADLPPELRTAITETTLGQLRAHQVNAIFSVSPVLMFVNIMNAALILAVLVSSGGPVLTGALWFLFVAAFSALSLQNAWRNRHRAPPSTTRHRTIQRVVRGAVGFGLLWALPGLLIVPQVDGFTLGFCLAVLTGMIAGGAYALHPIPAAALGFMLPLTVSTVLGIALSHGWLAVAGALCAGVFLTVFFTGTRRHAKLFVSEFLQRLELERRAHIIDDLLEDTRLEALGQKHISEARPAPDQGPAQAGDVAGAVAHIFNNLLTTIRGNADLLALDTATDQAALVPIVEATELGADRIDQLLLLTKKHRLTPERLDLGLLLRELEEARWSRLLANGGLQILRARQSGTVRTNPAALKIALTRLVADAVENSAPEKPVVLSIRSDAGEPASGTANVCIDLRAEGWRIAGSELARAKDPSAVLRTLHTPRLVDFAAVIAFARQTDMHLTLDHRSTGEISVSLRLPTVAAIHRVGEVPAVRSQT